jgi:hypothetical protein
VLWALVRGFHFCGHERFDLADETNYFMPVLPPGGIAHADLSGLDDRSMQARQPSLDAAAVQALGAT